MAGSQAWKKNYKTAWLAKRDESWQRWKSGAKLADELRTFYTAKSAFDRIASNNRMAPAGGMPAPNGAFRKGMMGLVDRALQYRKDNPLSAEQRAKMIEANAPAGGRFGEHPGRGR